MKRSEPARLRVIRKVILFLAAAGILHMLMGPVYAETPVKVKKSSRIHIITDQAVVDSRARTTEFTGNVSLSMDDTAISADWIKVIYKSGIKNASNTKMDEKSIDTITAKGHVKIKLEEITAETMEAFYDADENTILLTGENSRISSGTDYISCDRITINMLDQSFKAESSGKGPVEAFFQTKPDNFNLKK
ncbi:MAG: hypothetical protein KKF30_13655 [Proteobacteria bacterium]|nr:hypothetical protein [Pseudomonadota bacterium]MBU4469887.1 hypothetical protein [Pseudomonadota bacterium]MCG2751573.1 hypothetical protein [Desulfobacteraceae bacterium]